MTEKRLDFVVALRNEGLSSLTRVIEEMDKAGVETSEFKREAQLLQQQLAEMQRQQQLIESFAKIKEETGAAGKAMAEAQANAQRLGRELAATDAPTKKQTAEFSRAREAVNQTKDAYQGAQIRLQSMRGTLADNNIETTGLAQKQAALHNGVRDVEASVTSATERLKALGGTGPKAMADTGNAAADAATKTEGFHGKLTQVAQAVAGAFAVNKVVDYARSINEVADQYKNLEARLRLAVGAEGDLQTTVQGVGKVAKDTNSNLDASAELFGRLAASGKELNITNAEALGITKTINQAIQVSGASAQASEASVRQLVQALQSGTLRGDEFNSIMEQSPRLAKALADGLNVPVGALRGLAEQGELTSAKVVQALKGQAAAINQEFGTLPLTTGRALENLNTQWTLFIGNLTGGAQQSSVVAQGINALAENLDTLASIAARAGSVLTAALAVQGVQALRAFSLEMMATGKTASLLSLELSKVPKVISITVAAVGFEVGFQIGEMLHENSELARKLGVGLTALFQNLVNDLIFLKDAAAAIFTSDTIDAAFDRYRDRGRELDAIFGAMWDDAEKAPDKVAAAAAQSSAALGGMGQAGALAGQAVAGGGAAGAAGLSQVQGAATGALAVFKALLTEAQKEVPKQGAVASIVAQLVEARAKGLDLEALLSKQLPDALAKLNGPELAKFRLDFIKAMQDGGAAGAEVQTGLRLIGEQAAKSLGVDVRVASNQVTEGFRQADESMRMLILSMPTLKAAGIDTGRAVGEALSRMLDGAKSQAEIDAVTKRVQALRKELGDKVADGLLEQAKEKAEALAEALAQATPGINNAKEAMRVLGIVSEETLRKSASTAKEAYDVIATSGTASAREVGEAFRKAAEAAIAANGGIAPSWVKAEAAARGYEVAVDSAGRATLRLVGEASDGLDRLARGWRVSREAVQAQEDAMDRLLMKYQLSADNTERQIALLEREAAAAEKAAEAYRKKWNMDKEGYSLNTAGERALVGETKQQVDEDVARRYGQENVGNKDAERARQIAKMLSMMAEIGGLSRIQSPESSKQIADMRRELQELEAKLLNGVGDEDESRTNPSRNQRGGAGNSSSSSTGGVSDGNASSGPSSANPGNRGVGPSSDSGGGGVGTAGVTYISHINIHGIGSGTTRHADRESVLTEESLFRKLARAKSVAM